MRVIRNYKDGKLTSNDIGTIDNIVIWLMVLLTATSVTWSLVMHHLSGDFYNGFIGAKLIFHERDFTKLDIRAKEVLETDLNTLFGYLKTAQIAELESLNTGNSTENKTQSTNTEEPSTTIKPPKQKKILHLFQISSPKNVPENDASNTDDDDDETFNATNIELVLSFNALDKKFLSTMTIDVLQTRLRTNVGVQFVYSFPFFSEIIAIIWTAMCLIFQSGVKKYWGLPKPWRIVVPSLVVFSLMSLGSLVYTFLANSYLKSFCNDLRDQLSNPNALSCGQAISVLRPVIRAHSLSHDFYLNLFRTTYILSLILWLLALIVMLLRYLFAVDFQLVDIPTPFDNDFYRNSTQFEVTSKPNEFTEVLLSPSKYQTKLLQNDGRPKSEDDFQSAKSHFSEVVTPLLEQRLQQGIAIK